MFSCASRLGMCAVPLAVAGVAVFSMCSAVAGRQANAGVVDRHSPITTRPPSYVAIIADPLFTAFHPDSQIGYWPPAVEVLRHNSRQDRIDADDLAPPAAKQPKRVRKENPLPRLNDVWPIHLGDMFHDSPFAQERTRLGPLSVLR